MWREVLQRRRCLLQVLLVAMIITGGNAFFLDAFGWVLSAKSAVYGLSYILSFVKTAIKVFTLLNPTTGVLQVLRGRREVGWRYDNLESAFTSANLHDPMECLPLVMCAIHADPENLVSPMESKFRKAFRSFFSEKYSPVWAAKYLKATEVGESSKSVSSCQAAYPFCIFSPRHLRILISQAMDDYWNKENLNEVQS